MRRLAFLLVMCACALPAQTKKILVDSEEEGLVQDLRNVSPKARIVAVNAKNAIDRANQNS